MHGDDGWIAAAALQPTQILLTEPRQLSELFLRQPLGLSDPGGVVADQFAHVHAQSIGVRCVGGLSTSLFVKPAETRVKAFFSGFRHPLQKIRRLHTQNSCDSIHDIDAGIVDAAFERADIGAVKIRAMRQFFLRQLLILTQRPQISREHLSYFHERERIDLQSI
jgi:hypothetical protein